MRKSRYARTLHFMCIDPSDTYLHVKEIEKHLSIVLHKMTPDDLMLVDRKQSNRILLVDYKQVPKLLATSPNLTVMWKNHEIILFNVPQQLPTSELLIFGVLKGLFYNTDKKVAHSPRRRPRLDRGARKGLCQGTSTRFTFEPESRPKADPQLLP